MSSARLTSAPLPSGPLTSAATSADQYLTTLRDGWVQGMQQWVDQTSSAWDQWSRWSRDWTGTLPKPARPADHRHRGCDCHGDPRGCCGDACTCCVPEADVIVHARAGEVRVVPFRLTNHWRREREVTLAVGPWHRCGGRALDVRGVLEEDKVVLAPCEDRVVPLLVSVRGSTDRADQSSTGKPGDTTNVEDLARGADVDECVSAYADVRFEGCGRPLRVAVVVSPGGCDAVDVCCDCGCCC